MRIKGTGILILLAFLVGCSAASPSETGEDSATTPGAGPMTVAAAIEETQPGDAVRIAATLVTRDGVVRLCDSVYEYRPRAMRAPFD